MSPLFDNASTIASLNIPSHVDPQYIQDYIKVSQFLLTYKDNEMTFNAYRRDAERLLQWCFFKANLTLPKLTRRDFELYIRFCQNPPKNWIGTKKTFRFIKGAPNPEWRPFVTHVTKTEFLDGKRGVVEHYRLSPKSLREIFAVCSSLFTFLIDEGYVTHNPVMQIKQKSKYFTQYQSKRINRKLSDLQWAYVIETAYLMAAEDGLYERALFIMSALYSMYLRISELTASPRWTPKMGDFARDSDGRWWFTTVGKGNKERQIAVGKEMMEALKRWRVHLKLPPLPSLGENTPLIPKQVGVGPMCSTRPIRRIVQKCFDRAMIRLKNDGHLDEALQLQQATVHWLRHTGISEDVKHRPKEHVRDDAGHSSSMITDRYIDIDFQERHTSANTKKIVPK